MTGSGAEEPRSPNANSHDHKKQLRVIAHRVAVGAEIANHRRLRRLRAGVVSAAGDVSL